MKRSFYLFSNGRLRRRDNTLYLERSTEERTPDDAEADTGAPSGTPTGERSAIPVEQVDQIYAFGEIDVNSKLTAFLAKHAIPLHFFDYYGNYTGSLMPRESLLSGHLRVRQAAAYLSRRKRLVIARELVDAAAHNLLHVLRYYATRMPEQAEVLAGPLQAMAEERATLEAQASVAAIMGVEGRIRQHYYSGWPVLLGRGRAKGFTLGTRERRPPSNEANALLSFGNSLCYTLTLKQIHRTPLDPTVSFLHEPSARRYSLALDLSEPFKPLLVDRLIFRLVNKGTLTPRHFERRLGGSFLRDTGRRLVVEAWDSLLATTVQHRGLGRSVSYEHLVRLDCYRLMRALTDPVRDPFRAFRIWW